MRSKFGNGVRLVYAKFSVKIRRILGNGAKADEQKPTSERLLVHELQERKDATCSVLLILSRPDERRPCWRNYAETERRGAI